MWIMCSGSSDIGGARQNRVRHGADAAVGTLGARPKF